MLPGVIANQTVIRLRATAIVGSYNALVWDWAGATATDVPGCSLQPLSGSSARDDEESTIARAQLFAPPGSFAFTDRVKFGDTTYRIETADDWVDTTGTGLDHQLMYLTTVNEEAS